jgi:hypothetical protein
VSDDIDPEAIAEYQIELYAKMLRMNLDQHTHLRSSNITRNVHIRIGGSDSGTKLGGGGNDDQSGIPKVTILHVMLSDLQQDPVGTVETIYSHFGDTTAVPAGWRQRISAWLERNRKDKYGLHTYNKADFGLTPEKIAAIPAFQEYCIRFKLEC